MTTSQNPPESIDALIMRTPGTCGGRPHIRAHRVAVHRIAGWWKLGLAMEELAQKLPTLKPAEIHAALAFYHLHKEEIDGYLEEERSIIDAAKAGASAA